MQRPSPFSGLSPENCSLKKFLVFFDLKKSLIFSGSGTFRERNIQNPSIFRTRNIFRTRGTFRTLSNIYDGMFCKNSYLAHFSAPASKFFPKNSLYFLKKSRPNFQEMELFLYFGKAITELFFHFRKRIFRTLA